MAAEKNFENRVKKYLQDQGCWFIKYWGGAAYTKSGIPDLLVCCKCYFVAIEVKAPGGHPSELQKYNIKRINKEGGFAVVLRPDQFDDFKIMVQMLKDDLPGLAVQDRNKINERWGI